MPSVAAVYEIRWRLAGSDGAWKSKSVPASTEAITIDGLERGKEYEGEARALSAAGTPSDWTPVTFTVDDPSLLPRAPTGLTVLGVADGVSLRWTTDAEQPADVEYCIERASAVGGPYTEFTRVRAMQYTYPVTDGVTRWLRVRAVNFGLVYSAYSGVVSSANVTVAGGKGVNLLPDPYSTYESVTLPTIVNPLSIPLGRHGVTKYIAGSLIVGGAGTVYLGAALGNLPLTPGKRYIVSGYFRKGALHNVRMAIEAEGGTYYYSPYMPISAVNTWQRLSAILDLTASTANKGWLVLENQSAGDLYCDGLMVEEAIGDLNAPSTYSRGSANSIALAAFAAAAAAQDTADGAIVTFKQATPPAHPPASLGDFWIDEGHGNRINRSNGTSWVVAQDTGIPQAILDASNAQLTANGKVKTWFANAASPPTASAVGDMWYVQDQGTLKRWNGTSWAITADNAAEVLNDYVSNAKFEQGSQYWTLQAGWRMATNPVDPFQGLQALCADGGISPGIDSRAISDKVFSVLPGEVYIISAMVKQLTPNGTFGLGLITQDAAGTTITALESTQTAAAWGLTYNVYKKIAFRAVIPAGAAVKALVNFVRYGHSAGYWLVDNVTVTKMPTDLDDVMDSGTFGRLRQTTLQNGVVQGIAYGANLIPNPKFMENNCLARQAVAMTGAQENARDNWVYIGGNGRSYLYVEPTSTVVNMLFRVDTGANFPASDPYNPIQVVSNSRIPAIPGRKYLMHFQGGAARSVVPPAGFDGLMRVLMQWYRADSAPLAPSYRDINIVSGMGAHNYNWVETCPADAVFGQFYLQFYTRNTSGVAIAPAGQLWCDFRVWEVGFHMINNMDDDVDHGTTYGKPANTDLFDSGGIRRVGLRVGGSGQRVGNQSNLNQVVAQQVSTTTKLSATSAGAVSVNAHVLNYGSFTVSYSAVANAITGLTQNVTYVIYCFDDSFAGGTRTYFAGANPAAVSALGDGVVVVGQIKIPTSGSSSGGGGGGGTNPGDWCVASDSYLPDGTLARDIEPNMMLPCYNERPLSPGIRHLAVQRNDEADADCVRMVTVSGASIVASTCTPMTLRSGACIPITAMLYHDALVYRRDGSFVWEPVTTVEPVGVRRVSKIVVHQQCYFAGESMDAFIATHNVINQKP